MEAMEKLKSVMRLKEVATQHSEAKARQDGNLGWMTLGWMTQPELDGPCLRILGSSIIFSLLEILVQIQETSKSVCSAIVERIILLGKHWIGLQCEPFNHSSESQQANDQCSHYACNREEIIKEHVVSMRQRVLLRSLYTHKEEDILPVCTEHAVLARGQSQKNKNAYGEAEVEMPETQLEIQHQAKYTTKMKKPNDEKGLYY
ncbi:hypothetical protein ACRRTK_020328 [Alexandromys fortis]